MRHREVMKIASGTASRKTILPSAAHLQQVVAQSQVHQPAAAASLQTLINQSLSVMMNASTSKPSTSSTQKSETSAKQNHQPHLSIHQQQQQLQQQAQQQMQSLYQQQQQSKMNPRQRPILPKPSMQLQPDVQIWNHHAQQSNHHASVVDSAVDLQADARNRQGTVSVQSLIADYRAKHPEEIPTRGRRVRQPSRICNDANSSNSPPPGGLQQSPSVDPASGMSFKVDRFLCGIRFDAVFSLCFVLTFTGCLVTIRQIEQSPRPESERFEPDGQRIARSGCRTARRSWINREQQCSRPPEFSSGPEREEQSPHESIRRIDPSERPERRRTRDEPEFRADARPAAHESGE